MPQTIPTSPVFVVGSPRSGTSLVYSIILATNVFALYAAETLLLRTCADKYGVLSHPRNYNRFIHDWLRSKQFIRSGLDKKHFTRNAQKHKGNYLEFLDFFMAEVTKKQRKICWAENTPNHILEISNIAKYFPDSKFIHVIRDGRAVAASLNKLNWLSIKHPALRVMTAGIHWQTQVLAGRKQGQKLNKDRYMEVQYEDLICQPEKVLHNLSDFIGISINMRMLGENPYGALSKSNTVYGDTSAQSCLFPKEALCRWKQILSIRDQTILNTVIGDTLKSFGYQVGEKTPVNILATFCAKTVYHSKGWLRHNTIIGRKSETGLELNDTRE